MRLFGCPLDRLLADKCPAERTRRSAPPRGWFLTRSAGCVERFGRRRIVGPLGRQTTCWGPFPARWAGLGERLARWAGSWFGVQGCTVRTTNRLRPTQPGWRGGGPLCPLRWAWVRRQPSGGAGKRRGSARPLLPRGVRIGPCSGNPLGVRAVCHLDKPRGHVALTPALSRGYVGSVDRRSFCGRGDDARRCRGVSRRSSSPTDTRSVGSGGGPGVGGGAGDPVRGSWADCGCLGAHRIDCWRTSA